MGEVIFELNLETMDRISICGDYNVKEIVQAK